MEAIKLAALEDDLLDMKNGLDTQIGDQGNPLSGGQKQRLALARMFVHKSELYIMDDCTSAVDVATQIELWNNISNLVQESHSVCIIATNNEYILKHVNYVISLDQGKVVNYKIN